MIGRMAEVDRFLRVQLGVILRFLDPEEQTLHARIDAFLDAFCAFHAITPEEAAAGYGRFVQQYAQDMRDFKADGLYPARRGNARPPHTRDYHLFLLASPLVTLHRFRIMQRLAGLAPLRGNILSIGTGAGLELALLGVDGCVVDAFDPTVSSYASRTFDGVAFHGRPFTGNGGPYDAAFAVELLEHLEDPGRLVAQVAATLRPGGAFCFTTARNVPQFDHVVNFTDPAGFEAAVEGAGLRIVEREIIAHQFIMKPEDCDNVFYLARKPGGDGRDQGASLP
ncbi:MAG: class I SAM-dependent methyltransferase [Desulfovibrionaceae bacterium]